MTETYGDLFSANRNSSLAHCVSRDFKMTQGIAYSFKKKFSGALELLSQNANVGGLAILRREARYIYYLVTKERYFDKPTMATLESSLRALRRHVVRHNVSSISMPRIGCGLDKLQWPAVSKLIYDVFKYVDIEINIYTFKTVCIIY